MLALQAVAIVLAQAENPPPPVGARGNAAELGVQAGLVDGWGIVESSAQPGAHTRVPGIGAALEIEGGWRATSGLALGVWGFGEQLSDTAAVPSPADVYGAGAGLQGTWHLRPAAADLDPWVSLGTGWRALWLSFQSDRTTALHGFEIARVRVGVDVRVSPGLALAPVLGASLATYLTQEIEGGPWQPVPATRLDTYVFAGVRATLDLSLHRAPR